MIKVTLRDKQWQVPGNVKVRELITSLGFDPETVLAVREGKLIHNEARLGDQGELKLISVVSGG